MPPHLSHKSIAVLPLVNSSGQEEHEYLCDGMTEALLHALTRVEGLRVTSRTSSFFFKGKQVPLVEIGQQLGVSTILEGNVQIRTSQLRITLRLIDITEDYTFWSETYQRSMDDLFAVQEEIGQQTAEHLREHLGHFDLAPPESTTASISVDAYKRYLKSRYHMLKMNEGEIRKGLAILEDLVEEIPAYPYAYLGLHMGYTLLGTLGYMASGEAFRKGMPYLEQAIVLDESLPECQIQLAWMSFLERWDLDKTYRHLQVVRHKQPIVDFYQTMTSVIITERKYKAAMHYIDTALLMDPFSEVTHHLKGFVHYVQEQYEEANVYFQQSRTLKADTELSLIEWGQSLILLERPDEALQHFQGLTSSTDPIMVDGGLALAYTALKQEEQANIHRKKVLAAMDTDQTGRALQMLILVESFMGDQDQALSYIASAIEMKLPILVYLKIDPFLKPLHKHPNFAPLMDQVLGTPSTFHLTNRKYKKSLLSKDVIPDLRKKLLYWMEDHQPFLDPHLTLKALAEQIQLPPNQLSQLLNESFEQNFSDFVNAYRLEIFKEKIANPQNQHLTLLALAYESGFNSKTVFNTYFKKATGLTPRAYQKEMSKP
ncbi:MAG: helix-turn-helix domain-containing protein [Bacteroidota bacterium]